MATSHLTWIQKTFIATGVTSFAGVVVTFLIFVLSSAKPPACKEFEAKVNEQLYKVANKQDAFINRMNRYITIDSMKNDEFKELLQDLRAK